MMYRSQLAVGSQVRFEGEVCTVMGLDGTAVRLRHPNGRMSLIANRELIFAPDFEVLDGQDKEIDWSSADLENVPEDALKQAKEKAAHLNEAITGYVSGDPEVQELNEPRSGYDPDLTRLTERMRTKAQEIGKSESTLYDWKKKYESSGVLGLVHKRHLRPSQPRNIDSRIHRAILKVFAEVTRGSTVSRQHVLRKVRTLVEQEYGVGVVPFPSRATLYRELEDLVQGRGTFGPAKARRSKADSPPTPYLSLAASRPGEVVLMDSTPLDVFAIDPLKGDWVSLELSMALDLYTRSILAWRLNPQGTKAVDAALLLRDAITATPMRPEWPDSARWPYHGVPEKVVVDIFEEEVAGIPILDPEEVVVDNAKIFVGDVMLEACRLLGINLQPARLFKPTDKSQIERMFRTVRHSLLESMPGYKGPDVASRGERVEESAVYFIDEVEAFIAEWVVTYWQERDHGGLHAPDAPGVRLTPNQMYDLGLATSGFLYVPPSPDLYFELLPIEWRMIHDHGVHIDTLVYDGAALKPYRNCKSPYGGPANGRWPFRVDPRDLNRAYFKDPEDQTWHELRWRHAPPENLPFNDTLLYDSKKLLLARLGRPGRSEEVGEVLREILERAERGRVLHRRELRAVSKALMHQDQVEIDRASSYVLLDSVDGDAKDELVPSGTVGGEEWTADPSLLGTFYVYGQEFGEEVALEDEPT